MFLVDGSGNGVITAEIMNWTGRAVVSPRSKLPDLTPKAATSSFISAKVMMSENV